MRDINGVIQYGICPSIPETFQRGGRGGHDTSRDAFFVIMVEPWVTKLNLRELSNPELDLTDPDRPLSMDSKRKIPTKQERTGIAMARLGQQFKITCVRRYFAGCFQDTLPSSESNIFMV